MAKANFVKSAQKNIYKIGKNREYVSEKGKSKGQTKTVKDKTIPADESDEIFIAKGESYYWWQFKNSPKQYSKDKPKNSQLTQSNFLSTLYELEEEIADFSCETQEEFEEFRDDIKNRIEELRDTCQENLDAMPEGLQQGDTGQLLQERIDAMDSWASDIEGVECDIDDDEIRQEVRDENNMDDDDDSEEDEEESEEDGEEEEDDDEDNSDSNKIDDEEFERLVAEKIQEKVDESIEELQNQSHGL